MDVDNRMPGAQYNYLVLHESFPIAVGKIEPAPRLASGEISEGELAGFIQAIGESYVPVAATESTPEEQVQLVATIPNVCVDGRKGTDGSFVIGASAAAGTFSGVIGDALTEGFYRDTNTNAAAHASVMYQHLSGRYKLGGHDDNHAQPPASGCGAGDKLEQILAYIHENGTASIRPFLAELGIAVDTGLDASITQRAGQLLRQQYVVPGADIKRAMVAEAGPGSIRTLANEHLEVVLAINTQENTSLDRSALEERFGDKYQAFNVDVWALRNMANTLYSTQAEADRALTAMLYYNVATAAVLAGTSLRILVR